MADIDIWEHLKSLLLENISSARPCSGGNEVCMRCNNCDDHSTHLYIGMNNGIPMYHCKRCPNSGIVTTQFLNSIGIFDSELALELNKGYKESKYKPRVNKNNQRIYTIQNGYISDSKMSELKLAFINKRLGTQLTYNDIINLKIVLNLYDLLNYNNIKEYTRYPMVMDELNSSFIGFIAGHNGAINMRNLREGKVSKYVDKRYVNYKIFNDNMDDSYYIIPTQVYLNTSKRTLVCLAEGPFDILSVYLNLRNREPGIYYALQNKNYLSLIDQLIKLNMFYCEVHIYRDSEVDIAQFIQLSQVLQVFGIPTYLHTNNCIGEKDYGVSPDRIIDTFIQL